MSTKLRRSTRAKVAALSALALIVIATTVFPGVLRAAEADATSDHLALYQSVIDRAVKSGNVAPWSTSAILESYVLRYDQTGNKRYLAEGMENFRRLNRLLGSRINKPDMFTGREAPVWLTTNYSCGIPAAFLVHFGVIAAPGVAMIHRTMKTRGKQLSADERARITADLRQIETGLAYFDHRIRNRGKSLFYVSPKVPAKNTCKQLDVFKKYDTLPANMIVAAGAVHLGLAELYRDYPALAVTRAAVHREHYLGILQYVLGIIEWEPKGYYTWSYIPGGRIEDVSHAAFIVDFVLAAWKAEPDIVPTRLLKGLARTFHYLYGNGLPQIRSHLSDSYGSRGDTRSARGLAQWARLIEIDRSIYPKIRHIRDNLVDDKGRYVARSPNLEALIERYAK